MFISATSSRVCTPLTEELTIFRSILGGAGGRRVPGLDLGCRSREREGTDDAESRVDHTPLVCHRKRHDDWRPSPWLKGSELGDRLFGAGIGTSDPPMSDVPIPTFAAVKENEIQVMDKVGTMSRHTGGLL